MYDDLDIIFLGGLFPKEKEDEIVKNSRSNIQNAANNLQWSLVEGFDKNLENSIKVVNSLYIGSYPFRYKKMFIGSYKFAHNKNEKKDQNVGFLNLIGIKNLSRYNSLRKYFISWAREKSKKKKVIVAYAMTSTFTQILEDVKKIDNEIITCLIVPDLPQYMNLSMKNNLIYNVLKNLDTKKINSNLPYIDSYVYLTKYMQEYLNIDAPFVVIEGISTDIFEKIESSFRDEELKTILYTGGLNEKYGVIELVKSFEKLKKENVRLIICGSGDAESYVKQASLRDKRIIFKGLLERKEILLLQKNATLLINPRSNNEEYTKYSFPSKILEYMSSGTPVIAYMLDGMPREYRNYIYQVKNEKDEDNLYEALKEALSKTEEELVLKGKKAKDFVLSEKNSKSQVNKILQMINVF